MATPDKMDKICQGCGKPFAAAGGRESAEEGQYCRQCRIAMAEKYIPDMSEPSPMLAELRKKKRWSIAVALILLAGLGFAVFRFLPEKKTASQGDKPVRIGTYMTDSATDKCLKNLSELGKRLKEGKTSVDENVVCPVSGKPYVFTAEPKPAIHCPNPGTHGFRDILITKENLMPELKR